MIETCWGDFKYFNVKFYVSALVGVIIKVTNQLIMYTAKVAVCSAIRTKHSTQSKHHVEVWNVKPGGTERNREALKV